MSDDLPAIERPNGKTYRPRKVVGHILVDDDEIMTAALVLGTHDQERALPLAQALVTEQLGREFGPVFDGCGWWRDGMNSGKRCWIDDDERGAAGVYFKIEGRADAAS